VDDVVAQTTDAGAGEIAEHRQVGGPCEDGEQPVRPRQGEVAAQRDAENGQPLDPEERAWFHSRPEPTPGIRAPVGDHCAVPLVDRPTESPKL